MSIVHADALESTNLIVSDLAGTTGLAELMAPFIRQGDILLLDGELAAGKTHFVKALVKALGSEELVTSPTYALVHLYSNAKPPIVHSDAYRINSPQEFEDLGLIDYQDESITVIEWGSKVQSLYPSALRVEFGFVPGQPEQRIVRVVGTKSKWAPLIDSISRLSKRSA